MNSHKKFFNVNKIALTAILMAFGFGLFATGPEGKGATKVRKKKRFDVTGVKRTLSADESTLYKSVEEFYQKNYASIADDTETSDHITKVLVYDLTGNVLQEQDGSKKKVDLTKLPAHAKLLMTDNGTQYYLVSK